MRTKPAFLLILLLVISLVVQGCGSVARSVDPYYGEMPCQKKGGKEISCASMEEVYRAVTSNGGPDPSTGTYVHTEEKNDSGGGWKGPVFGGLAGAAIGAGIGALTAEGDDKVVERTLPGGGKFYEIVKKDADRVTAALVGAAIGVGAGAVMGYLVQKMMENHQKVDSALLKELHEKARKYEKCIKDAARLEKKKGPEAAAKKAKLCGTILAGLPGIHLYDSEQISTLVKLKREEQADVKKALAKALPGKKLVPLRTPPTVVEVLILPWTDKNDVFHQGENIYVVVDEGRWVIPSPAELKGQKVLRPLN